MVRLKELIKTIAYGHKANSQSYVRYLRRIGMEIGEDVIVYAPTKTTIDQQYPWMITIGNHVRITQGVIILTHDYSWLVLKMSREGAILGASGKITIGDNVFIGMNAIITRGVTIGNNVIIGAGSVVTKDCTDNGVYAGNPAKRIGEVSDYFEKRKQAQLSEAKELALQYYKRFGVRPPEEIFHEYFMVFETSDTAQTKEWCRDKMNKGMNYEESLLYMKKNAPLFNGYDMFWEYCSKDV